VKRNSNDTDLSNARRLALRHGANVRYSFQVKTWFVWDGRRWKSDHCGEVERLAKETVRSIYIEAGREPEEKARERLAKWAWESESQQHIRAMIALAQSEPGVAITIDQLDQDPWLFNCLNVTIDLRSGKLAPHTPEHLITKLAPVEFDPDAKSDLWEKFLSEATGSRQELVGFLQRAAGYSLTGDVSEEVLFFINGPTATAKSTFLEAMKAALGDYASTADFETFLKRKQVGQPRNDIARLAGARMVLSIEVDEGKHLAEGLVKMLTGGDTVSARFLYKEAFEFLPSFKLWLAANHAPKVTDQDAIWRRILRIPFDITVPKEKRDPQVKANLKTSSTERTAILAWAVRGCLAWQKDGLGVPPIVQQATQEYRQEMDFVQQFIQECCATDSGLQTGTTALFAAFSQWCLETGDGVSLSKAEFDQRLMSKGFVRGRSGKKGDRVWKGIKLMGESDATG